MPLPRVVARLNRVGLNRVTRPVAQYLPGLGVIEHRGRRSGRVYRTPVNVFPSAGGYVVALTYGAEADWVRNVLAAGGCTLHARGRAVTLTDPQLFHDESRQQIRPLERQVLRALRVSDFLSLHTAAAAPA